ncbi:MAG: cyclic nucleotide-binding domain-containing protein [Deltaproteobacteria bacterium]|nr:cyclic nucleotide-binding domain-containing protein [Deltaproteobacteria bacterium]MBW2015382.1 cyclic nucleotide-binding domain-containing protein [Deltaproteobacteria bacterium]MBW2128010.1 cyclic nucleotide-binding domain-containing protein [Deltaproteobacteria bacterium]MBW2302589.1 cyclic nucleotide-binding domain-containing protein [Deltaproteobacteria bacterium]
MRVADYLKEDEKIIEKLRELPPLKPFADQDLRGILELSTIMKYPPGSMIIEEGQYDNRIYFLISGKVGIQKQGKTIAFLQRKGDMFGEMGIIDGSPRSASILAVDETACLVVDISYMDRLDGLDRIIFRGILYRVFAEILASRLRMADAELARTKQENTKLRAELEALAGRSRDSKP